MLPPPQFQHPAEAAYARYLTACGILWEYEPHEFVLSLSPDGTPSATIRPDFYLPQSDRYIEITVLRSRGGRGRKRRKLRRLMALYPDVRIHLVERATLRALFVSEGWNVIELLG